MPANNARIIALYAGSFDPVTHGHLDVIRRASRLFNDLVVGVGTNPEKPPTFTPQERIEMLTPHLKELRNVRVAAYQGLTIDFAHACSAKVLVRGIRDMGDLSSELQIANLNLAIGGVETVFLLTSDQHVLTSSTYVKQIYEMGGADAARLQRLVPENVTRKLAEKLGPPRAAP
jgi:pantetheine-phosphate adenylyltransferase